MQNLKIALDLEHIESLQEKSKFSLLYCDTFLYSENKGCRVTQSTLIKYIPLLTRGISLVSIKSPAYYKEFSSVSAIDKSAQPLSLVAKIGDVYSLNRKYNFLLLLYNFLSIALFESFLNMIFSFNLVIKNIFQFNC